MQNDEKFESGECNPGIDSGHGPEYMVHWRLQIDPQKVHYLKYVLEGYDNTAIVSTLDNHLGIVDLSIAPGSEGLVQELLSAIANVIGLKKINVQDGRTAT